MNTLSNLLETALLKTYTLPALIMLVCVAAAMFVGCAAAQTAEPTPTPTVYEDPVMFLVGDGATSSGGTGWYAGYVICGQSGTYTLQISANGPATAFPVKNIKIIVCVSNEALSTATVTIGSDTASPLKLTSYTKGHPSYYIAQGGPFQEPDFYGYNDKYVINSLRYDQIHYPKYSYPLQVTVTFAPGATQNSKVMFLCYGTDANGQPAETSFSNGTLIVPTPEFAYALIPVIACFAGYGVYIKKKSR